MCEEHSKFKIFEQLSMMGHSTREKNDALLACDAEMVSSITLFGEGRRKERGLPFCTF